MRLKRSGLKPKPPEGSGQDASAEFNVHSFVVKVWVEEEATKTSSAIWRGHITHVPGSEKRYLKNLDDIALFIQPYLEAMGIQFGLGKRIKRCLSFRTSQPKDQSKKRQRED
jgi:hypothetical protein